MIGAAIGAAGALAGNIMQSVNAKKQREFEMKENEKARDWNAAQAEKANQWSIDQWNRNNAYNDPSQQMARNKAAGINPDLMYGQSSGGTIASQSPSVTPSAPAHPTSSDSYNNLPNWGNVGAAALAGQQMQANVDLTRAQADKIKAETPGAKAQSDILKTDASFRAALQTGELNLQNMKINLDMSQMDVNNTQIFKMRQEMQSLEHQANLLIVQRDNLIKEGKYTDAKTAGQFIDNNLKTPLARAQINSYAAAANLSYKQAEDIVKTQALRLLGLEQSALESDARTANLTVENDQLVFNLGSDKTWKGYERATKPLGDLMTGVGIAVGVRAASKNGKISPTRGKLKSTETWVDGKSTTYKSNTYYE